MDGAAKFGRGGVRQLAALAGTDLVNATDEPTALTDACAFIKLSHGQGRGMKPRTVINMAQNQHGPEPRRRRAHLRHPGPRLPQLPQNRTAARGRIEAVVSGSTSATWAGSRRSAAELQAALRAEIAALFEAAKDVVGLRGVLGFRAGGLLALADSRTPPLGVTA